MNSLKGYDLWKTTEPPDLYEDPPPVEADDWDDSELDERAPVDELMKVYATEVDR
jgi:hypothetical protein